MPYFFIHFLKNSPLNWGPLSDVNLAGNPHLLKTDIKLVVITLAVVVLRGIASGHLVARSIMVNRYLNPPTAVGNGPTKSMAMFSKGVVAGSLFCMGLGTGLVLSCFWHV